MSKKRAAGSPAVKGTGSKADRTRAGAAANPARTEDVAQPPKAPKARTATAASASAQAGNSVPRLPIRRPQSLNFAGVGRNDICPCGSGKRFKNCHGH